MAFFGVLQEQEKLKNKLERVTFFFSVSCLRRGRVRGVGGVYWKWGGEGDWGACERNLYGSVTPAMCVSDAKGKYCGLGGGVEGPGKMGVRLALEMLLPACRCT